MNGFGRVSLLFLSALLIIGVFGAGFFVGKEQARPVPIEGVVNLEAGKPGDVDFSRFWDAWRLLQERFAESDALDAAAMVNGAIAGMVDSLGDPYTVFLDAEDTERFLDDISGFFEGVGMEIGIRGGELQVVSPLPNTPAERAGLRPGDRILAVDKQSTAEFSVDEAVSVIRGPKGSTVTLTLFREAWGESREVEIERAVIEVPSLEWEMLEGNIAHIHLFQFSEKARVDFKRAVSDALNQGAASVVLDVRNNPGGFLEVAQDIAGWFLERDQVVVIEDFGGEGGQKVYEAEGPSRLLDLPVVVLINEGSASASEILAGALRDQRGARLVGKTSFGKGSVQELERLKDGSSVKITVARWLTPQGEVINEKGLVPDIEVERTEEDFEQDRDPQLDKAVEIVKGL